MNTPPEKKTTNHINLILEERINKLSPETIENLKIQFQESGLVTLSNLLPCETWKNLVTETENLIKENGIKRDITIGESANTRRKLTTVGNHFCRKYGHIIPHLYDSKSLLSFLSNIAGEKIFQHPNEIDQLAISMLTETNDTHGWHWDDHSFAMIWMIDSPPAEEGGFTQLIPNTANEKETSSVYRAILNNPIQSHHFPTGSFYFFKSGTTLHQVHPLVKSTRRLIVNMDWASESDLNRGLDSSSTATFY